MKSLLHYIKEDLFDINKSILIGETIDDDGSTISNFKNGVLEISSKNVICIDEKSISTYLKLRDQYDVKKFRFNYNLDIKLSKNFNDYKGLVLDFNKNLCCVIMTQHGDTYLKNVTLLGNEPDGSVTIVDNQNLWCTLHLENVNMNCVTLFTSNIGFPYVKNCKFKFSYPYIYLSSDKRNKEGLERCLKEDPQGKINFDYLFDTQRIPDELKKKYVFVIDTKWIIHKSNPKYKRNNGKISGEWKIV